MFYLSKCAVVIVSLWKQSTTDLLLKKNCSKIIRSDLINLAPKVSMARSEVEIRREDCQTDDEKMSHVSICDVSVVSPRNHARSLERFEMFTISWNHFVSDLP